MKNVFEQHYYQYHTSWKYLLDEPLSNIKNSKFIHDLYSERVFWKDAFANGNEQVLSDIEQRSHIITKEEAVIIIEWCNKLLELCNKNILDDAEHKESLKTDLKMITDFCQQILDNKKLTKKNYLFVIELLEESIWLYNSETKKIKK